MHNDDIRAFVVSEFKRFQDARYGVEETWLEAWAMYLGTAEAQEALQHIALETVGDVKTDWRHRISTGKAYESVETAHSYLMSATFPNREWFNAVPQSPVADALLRARLIRKLVSDKLTDAKFRSHWECFLRQLLITGSSVLALPWREETKKVKKWVKVKQPMFEDEEEYEAQTVEKVVYSRPELEVLDMFDCFYDPHVSNPNDGAFIRKLYKRKDEVMRCVKDGYYDRVTLDDIEYMRSGGLTDASQSRKDSIRRMSGMNDAHQDRANMLELIEYWGDVIVGDEVMYDHVVTVCGDLVLKCEPNPFWCGKPFVLGTFIPVPRQPYAVGYLQPNLGMLHELNIITNQRLDNLELSIDQMYTLVSDGLLQPEDVYSEPGRVFSVADHNDLRPIPMPGLAASITYTEAQYLESAIDKNFGSGAYVGANSQRSGERVTAAEIAAVREAGGNRLGGIHKHIEDTSLLCVLEKLFCLVQQFTTSEATVRVAGAGPSEYNYYAVSPEDLADDFKLVPVGSDHVLETKRYIEQRLSLVQAVSQVPEMAQLLDYQRVMTDLLQHWGIDEPEAYLKTQEAEQPTQQVDAPMDAMMSDQVAADGAQEWMHQAYGTPNQVQTEELYGSPEPIAQ